MGKIIVCIGPPKTGTTRLLDIVREYSDCKVLTRRNEHPEIADDFFHLTPSQLDSTKSYFCKSPAQIFHNHVIIEINRILHEDYKEIFNNYKIVINIRDPFEYLISFYKMRILEKKLPDYLKKSEPERRGPEVIKILKETKRLDQEHLEFQEFLSSYVNDDTNVTYFNSANTLKFIKRVLDVFGGKHVYLIDNEVLCHNQVERVFNFLEIPYKEIYLPSLDYQKFTYIDLDLFTKDQINILNEQYKLLKIFLTDSESNLNYLKYN